MRSIIKTMPFIIIIFCLFSSAGAGKLPETARLVPAETALLINADDFEELKSQFEKTNLYKLYKDPAMADFVEDAKEKLRNKVFEKDNEILRSILDGDVLPDGRMSIALVLNERALKEDEPQAFFLLQFGSAIEKVKELVEDAVRKSIEEGTHQQEENYRGISIKTMITEEGRFSFGFSSSLSYCFVDDCLIGSEDIELLRFAIAHIQGASSPALADDSDYSDAIGAIGANHDINVFVNIKPIVKMVVAEDTTGSAQVTISNLGFDNVVCACGSIDIARTPETSWSGKVFVKINGAKKGICKMLEMESATFRVPRFIPSSISSISFLNLDIQKAYNELSDILSSFSPQFAVLLHMPLLPASPEGEPGLELKSGIIDHLGSQIIFASGINKDISTPNTLIPADTLVAVAVENSRELEKSLSLLHSKMISPNNPDARRELLGYTLYIINLPAVPFPTPGQEPMNASIDAGHLQMPKLAFTVTETHLIFGDEPSVERAIRTMNGPEDASIAATKWFEAAKSALPSVVGFGEMEDSAASGEVLWDVLKERQRLSESQSRASVNVGLFPTTGPFPMFMLAQGLFDTSLLPEFDLVRKYFGLSVDYIVSRPDGFLFEFKSLKPIDN